VEIVWDPEGVPDEPKEGVFEMEEEELSVNPTEEETLMVLLTLPLNESEWDGVPDTEILPLIEPVFVPETELAGVAEGVRVPDPDRDAVRERVVDLVSVMVLLVEMLNVEDFVADRDELFVGESLFMEVLVAEGVAELVGDELFVVEMVFVAV
jgi:hypothetical protein